MLRNYQRAAANYLWNHPRAAIFLGCGYGKTLIVLTVLDLLLKRKMISSIALVAPPAVLKSTWQDEAKKWGMEHIIKHIHFVSNCNTVKLAKAYDVLIVDELSAFKETRTKRFRELSKVQADRVIGLTGTPVNNSLIDLYAQMKLIIPQWYTKSQFTYMYFIPGASKGRVVYNWIPQPKAEERIYENIKDYCFKVDAAIELPDISYQLVNVPVPAKLLTRYKKFKKDSLLELKTDTITAVNGAVLTNKLLQFCSGSMVTAEGTEEVHKLKLAELERFLYEPSVIFYGYKHDKAAIEALLTKKDRSFTSDDFEGWNKGQYDHLILHPQSAAYGLNLQDGGRMIIWYTLTWSLEKYIQANARLHRSGQKKGVIVKHLITEGTDEIRVYQALQNKEKTLDMFLAMFDN